jgi:hypothetical protein
MPQSNTEAEFMNNNFVEVSGHNLSEFFDLRFPFTMFSLQASFKLLLLKRVKGGGGGGAKSVCSGDCE